MDVDRQDSRGLIEVGDDQRSDFVRASGDGGEVLYEGAAEGDVRDGDELSVLVNRGEHQLQGKRHAVGRRNAMDLSSLALQCVIDVVIRRKIQSVRDDLIACAVPIEAGDDHLLAQ